MPFTDPKNLSYVKRTLSSRINCSTKEVLNTFLMPCIWYAFKQDIDIFPRDVDISVLGCLLFGIRVSSLKVKKYQQYL